jgi:hypothetical protein
VEEKQGKEQGKGKNIKGGNKDNYGERWKRTKEVNEGSQMRGNGKDERP